MRFPRQLMRTLHRPRKRMRSSLHDVHSVRSSLGRYRQVPPPRSGTPQLLGHGATSAQVVTTSADGTDEAHNSSRVRLSAKRSTSAGATAAAIERNEAESKSKRPESPTETSMTSAPYTRWSCATLVARLLSAAARRPPRFPSVDAVVETPIVRLPPPQTQQAAAPSTPATPCSAMVPKAGFQPGPSVPSSLQRYCDSYSAQRKL
mmetsp:Transcript_33300/g.87288  ORF Transcript_33300/g.87288 Transcript_33300/m.87288 type:complete len:205 (-) Transcript_33300:1424-2038(-)